MKRLTRRPRRDHHLRSETHRIHGARRWPSPSHRCVCAAVACSVGARDVGAPVL